MISYADVYNLDNSSSIANLREMEMIMEHNGAHCIQFFKDLEVYGLEEAIVYVRGYEESGFVTKGNADELQKVCDRIKKKLGKE
tara:strand:- start:34 stop:285 length:252 start_codon:yes stop_codon:yes gene_type:complete